MPSNEISPQQAEPVDYPAPPPGNRIKMACLVAGVVLQLLLLPRNWDAILLDIYESGSSRHEMAEARLKFAIVFDVLWFVRAMLPVRGWGWYFYALLMLTSPAWIVLAGWLTVGQT